jgi:hypothetical protein
VSEKPQSVAADSVDSDCPAFENGPARSERRLDRADARESADRCRRARAYGIDERLNLDAVRFRISLGEKRRRGRPRR